MGCVATLSVAVVQVALPAASATVLQIVVAPSLKVTVPVGEPGLTVAVNVTDWPYTEGFAEDDKLMMAAAWLTVCPPASVPEALALKLPSPLYTALTECGLPATVSVLVLNVAVVTPALVLTEDGARAVPSIVNVTVPVGFPPAVLPGPVTFTVAVKVTDDP